jgi:hypothetical protein
MKTLTLNLRGRLRNFRLPESRALWPLFEALINAIHAIDTTGTDDGSITIEILRGPQEALDLGADEASKSPICGFKIIDNGVGFDDQNYDSFCTSDSTFKVDIGGRGIGRFTWLKAFERVTIDSVYRGESGQRRRSFTFCVDGVKDLVDAEAPPGRKEGTTIELADGKTSYLKTLPRKISTIGQRVVDHCIVAIRGAKRPIEIAIRDKADVFDIKAEVDRMLSTADSDEREILGHKFRITHLRVMSPEANGHRLAFLANRREVKSYVLGSEHALLKQKLEDEDGNNFWWVSLVESDFLDSNVSSERDAFLFPDETDPLYPHQLSQKRLQEELVPVILGRLEKYIEPVRSRAKGQVQNFITGRAPEYRYLLAMKPPALDAIAPDLTDEKLDAELHRITYHIEIELKQKSREILAAPEVSTKDYDEFLSDANELGKANLAKYVVHRRVILELLSRSLERREETGKYELEEAVHRIMLPLRKTSDEVSYEQLNLWLIDERLSYHYYLASDKELKSMSAITSDGTTRPDVIIFNKPIAFVDHAAPYGSIVIIEFKRPARSEYDDSENPVAQVFGYVRKVREGTASDRSGRPIVVGTSTPFYCYIICDLTSKLKMVVENYGLKKTPDEQGYFGFNENLKSYIEVISFDKMVSDAMKRNRILFRKLTLPAVLHKKRRPARCWAWGGICKWGGRVRVVRGGRTK